MIRRASACLVVVFCVAACTPAIQPEDQARLTAPTQCDTAAADIAALQEARPSGTDRTLNGLRLVTPAGIVTGLATGQMTDRARVADGSYTSEIDARIAQIRAECGI